jgi:plastocyanin
MSRRWGIGAVLLVAMLVASCSTGGGGAGNALELGAPTPSAAAPSTTPHRPAPAPSSPAPRTSAPARTHPSSPAAARHATAPASTPTPRPPKPSTGTHSTKPTTHPSSQPPATSAYVIKMLDYHFSPANPSVPVGTTVRVVDDGASSHTWTSGTAPVHSGPFDSGNVDPGHSYTYTFHTAGTYSFFCQYHYSSGMKGRITVR